MKPATLVAMSVVLCLAPGLGLAADKIVRTSGEEIPGQLALEVLVLETGDAKLEIPRASIQELRVSGGLVRAVLLDGSVVSGTPIAPDVGIDTGLYSQRIAWENILSVELGDLVVPPLLDEADGFIRVDDAPLPREPVEGLSPLFLELDVGAIRSLPFGKRSFWTSNRLRNYYCEDVAIPSVRVQKNDEAGLVVLSWYFQIYVRWSYDRLVDLKVQLIDGSETVFSRELKDLDAEEGKAKQVKIEMRFRRPTYEKVFVEDSSPRLRLTLAVREG